MILVTGGAGFIGANFVLDWIANGDEPVVNLDKLTYAGNLHNLASVQGDPRHIFVQGDIGDPPARTPAGRAPARAIVNFAAEAMWTAPSTAPKTSSRPTSSAPSGFWRLQGNTGKRCQLSKRSVPLPARLHRRGLRHPLGHRPRLHRRQPYEPNSPYSASKAASDHLVRAWHHTYGLPVLTTNCSNNYGPLHFPEKLIPLMIVNALAGKPARVRRRHAGARLAVRARPLQRHPPRARSRRLGETYNVGGWNEKPNIEIVNTVCALLDELRPAPTARATAADHLRHRPPRPRPPLRHRRPQDRARAGLEARRDLRHRHPQDRAVVPGQPGLGGAGAIGAYRDWVQPNNTGAHEHPALRQRRPGRLGAAAQPGRAGPRHGAGP
jgi:dTDP-glucose 4,6-dehydratase